MDAKEYEAQMAAREAQRNAEKTGATQQGEKLSEPTTQDWMRKTHMSGITQQQQPRDTLSGQQLQALANDYAAKITAIKRDIELRKWAVDQACGLAGSESVQIKDPIKLARELHAFLVEAATSQERVGGEKAE